jgi:hypothetical protein
MDDELLDEIVSEILGHFGDEHNAVRRARAAALDIMVLFERERAEDAHSAILDIETRQQ